jgi:hypothetical protein
MCHTRLIERRSALGAVVLAAAATLVPASTAAPLDWTHRVRVAGHSLHRDNADAIVAGATASGVFGIEVDNDIPGRYESLIDPTEKLAAIRAVAERAHRAGNRSFVYIAGWECITANADKTDKTLAKEHPDWVQRKITGEPANFTGGAAFWIDKGDEDVWISPYATEWRKLYMERVRQIAATGIDGIYVDVPYWMTHFEGWEDSWASFDDHTVDAFRRATGLDARHDLRLGDFADENFRKWVAFRIRTITEFMVEVRANIRSVNPRCMTIAEIYPGIEEEAVRVGADVYELYGVVDVVAHEYEYGGGDHMAVSRQPLDWFRYMTGMLAFRAFAGGRATWILNYSWDGHPTIPPREPMLNLFGSHVVAGANTWDAATHVMSGSNDLATRKEAFAWIAAHERTFYDPRSPIDPVGLYFSPESRNRSAVEFVRSFQGLFVLLMQRHLEVEVVTPRTLGRFSGRALVLPDVSQLAPGEKAALRRYAASGHTLVVTGRDATGLGSSPRVVRFAECPGRAYFAALEKGFDAADPASMTPLFEAVGAGRTIAVDGSKNLATIIARVDGRPHVFIANYGGLEGGKNAVQKPERDVRVSVVAARGRGMFLPLYGETVPLDGVRSGDRLVFTLPAIAKGGVFWLEPGSAEKRRRR